jgi:hypothetical protein
LRVTLRSRAFIRAADHPADFDAVVQERDELLLA